jgi:glycosyltransferase involved in cell wall biosynthesis
MAGMRSLLSANRRLPFDAVLTTFHWPPSVPGLPTCGVIHDVRALHGRGRSARQLQAFIARSWAQVLVPSAHVAEDVRSLLGLQSLPSVIGEGLDHLEKFLPKSGGGSRHLIAVIGGQAEHKRAGLGVAAATRAAERLKAEIVVLGPVPGGCPSSVSHMPAPSDPQLAAVYGSARVVVAPSRYEGFGLAAGEALRCGAPVVYARDGTLASLVGGAGVSALPASISMADGIVEAWARSDELAAAGRRIVEPLTWASTARTVLSILSLVAPNGRGTLPSRFVSQ